MPGRYHLLNCLIFGKLYDLSKLQFPHLLYESNNSYYPQKTVERIKINTHKTAQCLTVSIQKTLAIIYIKDKINVLPDLGPEGERKAGAK